ncbi:MATE family efflux transporter [Mangrovivirga cuniculi]|uniref:Polysaccharide biosynthesis protein C-terminal domain-containing protein n=1 Tax=Mangrovivirga cuniculi TaxID=2715131 RepID=A0A4D7JIV7_9BACT|nr:hypothetical protein [Mangrovivirga cuniculi]QCK15919.1 hypothetical protein DCC35_14810 [Mangrovivirga cuniculi]
MPLQIAIRTIILGVLSVGLNILFIVHYKLGYMGWFWSSFIVGVLRNLSYFFPLNYILKLTPIFNFKWRYIRSALKISLPMVPHYYSSYLLESSDKLIMDVMKVPTANIGRYNIAYTVGKFTNSLGTASGLAVGPLLNGYYKKNDDKSAAGLIFILQISFLIITFILSIWMKELFGLLIKNVELASMYYLGVIIVMAYNYRPMYFGANAKLMYIEKTNLLWRVTFGAGIINLLLNICFIPIFGFEVAAYTTFVSYMVMGYSGYYFKVFSDNSDAKFYPMFWLLLTIILTVFAKITVEFEQQYKIFISFITLGIGTLFIYKINNKIHAI